MKQEILFVVLDQFADWEGAYVAPSLAGGIEPGTESPYVVKTVSVNGEPVRSCGGFTVLPDYSVENVPADYAGVVLIGGMSWFTPEAERVLPLVKEAIGQGRVVAGICNASVFLAKHGLLNDVRHTSNGIDYLKVYAGALYTGESHYTDAPAVRDGKIVTANGFSALEFGREIFYALNAFAPKQIERLYRMNKTGVWEDPEV